jgi:hypothetical protein
MPEFMDRMGSFPEFPDCFLGAPLAYAATERNAAVSHAF